MSDISLGSAVDDRDTISRKAVIDAFYKLDIELRPSAIYKILCMFDSIPPKGEKNATERIKRG